MMKNYLCTFLFLMIVSPAFASSSAWFETDGAKIRLIALPSPDGKTINAGLQINLDKGWKTYWRSPGASGLPPQISFDGSKNIASTNVEYPVPSTFGSAENLTAGYNEPVTFPITVEPLFPGRAVNLKATGVIGICEEICVPVQFNLSLTEDGKGQSTRDVASALLQAKSGLTEIPREGFRIENVFVNNRLLTIEASVPDNTSQSSLIVEAPSDWYLTPVHAKSVSAGKAVFEISLKDVPTDSIPERTLLNLLLLSDGVGVEQKLMPVRR